MYTPLGLVHREVDIHEDCLDIPELPAYVGVVIEMSVPGLDVLLLTKVDILAEGGNILALVIIGV